MPAKPRERIYWDASVYIAWIKAEPRANHEMDGVKDCVSRLLKGELLLCTSAETRNEVLEGRLTPDEQKRYNQVMKSRSVQFLPWNPRIEDLVKEIREYYYTQNEPTPGSADARHLAYAIHYEVDAFHTFDRGKKGGRGLLGLDGDVAGHKLRICIPPAGQGWLEF